MVRLDSHLGGAVRRRTVILLACILGLDSADKGAIGALAVELERSLHINNTEIGLLVTISSLVGAVATIPSGALTDRTSRTRLLTISILVWGAAQITSGLSISYLMLLLTRLFLGAVTATAAPAVASLTGDLFPAAERGRIYGFIITGELIGAGFGILVAGEFAGLLDWRAAFFILAVPSLALAWALHRFLPEPARGGQSRLEPGAQEIASAEMVAARPDAYEPEAAEEGRSDATVLKEVKEQGFKPKESIVLRRDPAAMNIAEAIRYVLRVKTNVVLIVSGSLGYFFFSGLQTFAILFLRDHYGLGQFSATAILVVVGLGAIVGVLVAGRLADGLIRQGKINARLVVGAAGYVVASILFIPAILSGSILIALPIYVVAGAALAAPNAPLSAARLDVIPSRMWGRAEGVRTLLQTVLQAFAPLLFGVVSQALGSGHAGFASSISSGHTHVSARGSPGLEYTLLIMLVPMAVAGFMLLRARSHYPVDVASAGESDRVAAGAYPDR
ncbi:MAG: MFS transporter [Acidimicrobiales bacterium]